MITSGAATSIRASMKVCIAHHGIGTNPAGSGTRRSLAKTRCTATGVKTASGIASRNDRTERRRDDEDDQRRGRDEAQPVDPDHVEQQERRRQQDAQARNDSGVGLLFRTAVARDHGFGLFLEAASDSAGDQDAADAKPDPDDHRKDIGTNLLPRDRRQARAEESRERAQRDDKRARRSIGQAHLRFRRPVLTCGLSSSRGPPTSVGHPSWPRPRP